MRGSVGRRSDTVQRPGGRPVDVVPIPLGGPSIDREDLRAVASVLATGNLTQGPIVEAFEVKLAGYLGAHFAVAVSSGTAALHLALRVFEVGPGDEVVVPAFTFPATANVVEWLGARPVFCDIAPGGYNAGPEEFARAVTRRTRAVMPVHAFGTVADVPAIARAVLRVARGRRRVVVVEDAACALGASLRGIPAGLLGDVGCLSFHPRKVLTTGEGGGVLTRRRSFAERVRALRSHGLVRAGRRIELREPGLNYRMTQFQAALGLSQLSRLEAILACRARIASVYRRTLASHPQVRFFTPPPDQIEACQAFVVMFPTTTLRDRVQAAMARAGIETTFGTYCVPLMRYYRERYGLQKRMFPNAWGAHKRTIALPLHPGLTAAAQTRVMEVMLASLP
jgi:perosamine synthetase